MKILKRIVEFFSRIKTFFHSYDEEMLVGIDLDKLEDDPQRSMKIKELIDENIQEHQLLTNRYHRFMNEYVVLEHIYDFGSNDSKQLQALCRQYSEYSVSRDDAELRNQEAKKKEDPTVVAYVNDIPKAIKLLKEHEAHQQMVNHDLTILEGEKADLVYQFKNLKSSLAFLKYFFVALSIAALGAGVVLSTLVLVYNKDVFFPALITIMLLAFLFMWAYVFRRYCAHGIKKNQMMQERAIKLINKTKIKYVHNQQLLEYQYAKYKVSSSQVLELRYENYLTARDEAKNYESVNQLLRNIAGDIEDLLMKKHIENTEFILQNVDYFATDKGIASLKENYEDKRKEIQKDLKRLEREKVVLTNFKKQLKEA